MNLEKIKELETLKKELQKYGSQYGALSDQKRHDYIVKTEKDFIVFFKEKGFAVNETTTELQASYGGTRITIDKYNEKEWYAGCYAVWVMNCSFNKSKYRILLNGAGSNSGINVTFSSNKALTEDEKMDKDIKDTAEKIEKIKNDIENFYDFKFVYTLRNESEKSTNNKSQEFEEMKHLLESLFS